MAALLKFDKTSFRIVSFSDKGQNKNYWLSQSVYQRLCASWYRICASHNIPYSADHKIDRDAFRIRKLNNGSEL